MQKRAPRILSFLTARLRRRNWQVFLGFVAILLTAIWIFNRNSHLSFDAHHWHDEDDTTFFHWCAGWFKDWGRGPLYASIVEGPKVDRRGPLSRSHYLRFLRKLDKDAEILYFSDEYHGLTFGVSYLPTKRRVVTYSSPGGSQNTLYQTNDWSDSIDFDNREEISLSASTWMAWSPTRWELNTKNRYSVYLGNSGEIRPNRRVAEWAFIFTVDNRSVEAEVLIGYDREQARWRIFDREYSETLEINSWLKHIGKY